MTLTHKILDFLKLPSQKKCGVAFSGGKDSAVLLHFLVEKFGSEQVVALHVDHGTRSEESQKKENSFVTGFCSGLNVLCLNITLERGIGTDENSLRQHRYLELSRLGTEHHLEWIALGHHAMDQAETFFMRLLRGTDLRGLCGMPTSFTRHKQLYTRPFLGITPEDLLKYKYEEQIDHFDDPSNQSDLYHRNFFRNKLAPLLESFEKGCLLRTPALAASIQEFCEWKEDRFKSELGGVVWKSLTQDEWIVEREVLKNSPAPLLKEWCRHSLEAWAKGARKINRQHIDDMAEFIRSERCGYFERPFPGKIQLRARKRELVAKRCL